LLDEACRPCICEIGSSKVGAAKNKFLMDVWLPLRAAQSTMQVDETIEFLVT